MLTHSEINGWVLASAESLGSGPCFRVPDGKKCQKEDSKCSDEKRTIPIAGHSAGCISRLAKSEKAFRAMASEGH